MSVNYLSFAIAERAITVERAIKKQSKELLPKIFINNFTKSKNKVHCCYCDIEKLNFGSTKINITIIVISVILQLLLYH